MATNTHGSSSAESLSCGFPINRRHQGLATVRSVNLSFGLTLSFQSIGVTKDWRHTTMIWYRLVWIRFQSIGVTKDWRLTQALLVAAARGLRISNQ